MLRIKPTEVNAIHISTANFKRRIPYDRIRCPKSGKFYKIIIVCLYKTFYRLNIFEKIL